MDLVILKSPWTNPQWITRDNCSVWGMWFQGTALKVRKSENGEEKGNRGMYTELAITWMTRSLILCKPNASQNHSLGKVKRKYLSVSLVAQEVKNLLAMRETQVQSLGQEDALEKEMATHSCILAWRISWREEPGGLQSLGSQSWTQLSDKHFHFPFSIDEG